ncbi:MAG: hypothetical protein ACFE9T_15930 [Promethearchaeota archaeon]
MKDIVTLKKSTKGKSLKFLISPPVQETLNIDYGDSLQIDIYGIYKEGKEMIPVDPPVPNPGIVMKAGGTSKGITMKKDVVKLLQLKAEQMLGINIQIEKKKEPDTD